MSIYIQAGIHTNACHKNNYTDPTLINVSIDYQIHLTSTITIVWRPVRRISLLVSVLQRASISFCRFRLVLCYIHHDCLLEGAAFGTGFSWSNRRFNLQGKSSSLSVSDHSPDEQI